MNHSELFADRSTWLMEERALRSMIARAGLLKKIPTQDEVEVIRRQRLDVLKRAAGESAALRNLGIMETIAGVGVVNISGPIEQRLSWLSLLFGGSSTEMTEAAIARHMADGKVSSVVLHIDSPGGTVYRVQELADYIYQSRGTKPIYAHADPMAASAAYWIATNSEKSLGRTAFGKSGGPFGGLH